MCNAICTAAAAAYGWLRGDTNPKGVMGGGKVPPNFGGFNGEINEFEMLHCQIAMFNYHPGTLLDIDWLCVQWEWFGIVSRDELTNLVMYMAIYVLTCMRVQPGWVKSLLFFDHRIVFVRNIEKLEQLVGRWQFVSYGGFHKRRYLDMYGLECKISLIWMIWGYPHLWKPPYRSLLLGVLVSWYLVVSQWPDLLHMCFFVLPNHTMLQV